jgi:hypothetical protein
MREDSGTFRTVSQETTPGALLKSFVFQRSGLISDQSA